MTDKDIKSIKDIPQHNLPEYVFDDAREAANNCIIDAADNFLKTYNIDSNDTIGINAINKVIGDSTDTDITINELDNGVSQTIKLFKVIQKLTKAQEAVRAAEQDRIKAYEEYNITNKRLIEIENTKLRSLEDIMNLLNSIIDNRTIESSLLKLIENQIVIYNTVYRILNMMDTMIRVLQMNNTSSKASHLLEDEAHKLQDNLKEIALPHVNINVPVNNAPTQQQVHGNIYTNRDFNIK